MSFELYVIHLYNSMVYLSYNILFHHIQKASHPARSSALMFLLIVPSELVVEETSQKQFLSDKI